MKDWKRARVPLAKINTEDKKFIFTYGGNLEKLLHSIAKVGVLNPPRLQKASATSNFRIICGYRRVLALQQLGIESTPAWICAEDAQNDLSLFLLNLYDNLGSRKFNDIEKSLVLNKLIKIFAVDKEHIIRYYLPLLDLGSNPRVLDFYLPLIDLEEDIKEAIIEERLSLEIAAHLLQYPSRERMGIFNFISKLRLGKNRQHEFFRLLHDLSLREHIPPTQVIAAAEIQSLLGNSRKPIPERAERIRRILKRRRYPRFSQVAEEFEAIRKSMKLPPQITLRASEFFEDNKFTVQFSFSSQAEFSVVVNRLQNILDQKYITELEQLIK